MGDQLDDVLAKIGAFPKGVEEMIEHSQDDQFTSKGFLSYVRGGQPLDFAPETVTL